MRRFDGATGIWVAAFVKENYDLLRDVVPDVAEAVDTAYQIGMRKRLLSVSVPYQDQTICQLIPEYRMFKDGAWVCKVTRRNVLYLHEKFPDAEWSAEAEGHLNDALDHEKKTEIVKDLKAVIKAIPDVEVTDYKWGTKPYIHQKKAFLLSRDLENFALLMEQGTGKTKVLIDTAVWAYINSRIDGVLVICPNSVKSVWPEEIALHTPSWSSTKVMTYSAGMNKASRAELECMLSRTGGTGSLDWLIMNVESFSTAKGGEIATRFLKGHQTLMTVDEATRIKTPGAHRTKNIIKLRHLATMRRILSGLLVTNSPLDVFGPFKFLDVMILGFTSFYAFRNHFAIMGGWNGKEVVQYANLDELQILIDAHSYRVLKVDCLDLPPKIYQKLVVKLSPEQQRVYDEMRDDMIANLSEAEHVSVTMVLVQMLRLQQIVGGFVGGVTATTLSSADLSPAAVTARADPRVSMIPGTNPKMKILLELTQDIPGKMIIWARFRAELAMISSALRAAYGHDAVVEFHGGRSVDERTEARVSFQDPDGPVRFFIGNPQAGGMGITLTQATTVVYFSNSFSLEDRLQSEDRSHRIGQKNNVTYIDLVAKGTVDTKIVRSLRSKHSLASQVSGDSFKEWI